MSEKTHTSRLASYKNAGHGTTDLRRKRAEVSVALRKQARDEQLLKRRALSPDGTEDVGAEQEKVLSPAEIVQGLKSSDLSLKTTSARSARRVLSREQNPPISVMVQAGVIAPLVDALDRDDCADLQFEAAWALTNIASGTHEHTMAVMEGGAIPKLVHLLSQGGVVGEQSAWALGNIAGDGAPSRDMVLAHGALPALMPILKSNKLSELRTAVWAYSNLCRNKNPMVKFEQVSPALPLISDLLLHDDADILADACWALSYLTDGPNDRIEGVQTTPELLVRVAALLQHRSAAVKTPALRAVGNMLTGDDTQTDRCLNAGCLEKINELLLCSKASLVKEAAWAVSNVLAGTQEQIQRAIDLGTLQNLRHVLANEDVRCQKEAAWAITNLCLGGSAAQLDAMLRGGVLPAYCACLAAADARTVTVVLDGLTHLLQAAEKYGQVEPLCLKLEEIGALDHIESLQQHENEQIYKKNLHILENYFAEQEDANNQPPQTNEEYQFVANTNQNINF